MYKKIAKIPTVLAQYAEKLIKSGIVTQQEYEVCVVKIQVWGRNASACIVDPDQTAPLGAV